VDIALERLADVFAEARQSIRTMGSKKSTDSFDESVGFEWFEQVLVIYLIPAVAGTSAGSV
jgi:hypothetical protein